MSATELKILRAIASLSVGACLQALKGPIVELVELFGVQPNKVLVCRDAAGSNLFHELEHLAIDVLSLPHSNAEWK
ncbi:hypothetical protein MTO96_027320 [Rhipicephalus appendiculatus]